MPKRRYSSPVIEKYDSRFNNNKHKLGAVKGPCKEAIERIDHLGLDRAFHDGDAGRSAATRVARAERREKKAADGVFNKTSRDLYHEAWEEFTHRFDEGTPTRDYHGRELNRAEARFESVVAAGMYAAAQVFIHDGTELQAYTAARVAMRAEVNRTARMDIAHERGEEFTEAAPPHIVAAREEAATTRNAPRTKYRKDDEDEREDPEDTGDGLDEEELDGEEGAGADLPDEGDHTPRSEDMFPSLTRTPPPSPATATTARASARDSTEEGVAARAPSLSFAEVVGIATRGQAAPPPEDFFVLTVGGPVREAGEHHGRAAGAGGRRLEHHPRFDLDREATDGLIGTLNTVGGIEDGSGGSFH
ncbi:MAG: hypothetical protein RLN62_03060 [Rickettsiales bacterium]